MDRLGIYFTENSVITNRKEFLKWEMFTSV